MDNILPTDFWIFMFLPASLCVIIYLMTVVALGRPMADESWKIWNDDNYNDKWMARFMFPFYTYTKNLGNDWFGMPFEDFFPIVACHGAYTGYGPEIESPISAARPIYLFLTSFFWPIKLVWGVIMFLMIWGVINGVHRFINWAFAPHMISIPEKQAKKTEETNE